MRNRRLIRFDRKPMAHSPVAPVANIAATSFEPVAKPGGWFGDRLLNGFTVFGGVKP